MLKKLRKNQKGFTLIEVLIVVAILIILAAVAVPNIAGLRKEAQRGVEIANASEIATAINVYNSTREGTDQIKATGTENKLAATDIDTAILKLKTAGLLPVFKNNKGAEDTDNAAAKIAFAYIRIDAAGIASVDTTTVPTGTAKP